MYFFVTQEQEAIIKLVPLRKSVLFLSLFDCTFVLFFRSSPLFSKVFHLHLVNNQKTNQYFRLKVLTQSAPFIIMPWRNLFIFNCLCLFNLKKVPKIQDVGMPIPKTVYLSQKHRNYQPKYKVKHPDAHWSRALLMLWALLCSCSLFFSKIVCELFYLKLWFCCYANPIFLAKQSLIRIIVTYVQYLHSQDTHIIMPCTLHISSLINSYQLFSFYSKKMFASAISSASARQRFLLVSAANSHLSPRHICSVWQWLQCGPAWGGGAHQLQSVHVGPYINHPGEERRGFPGGTAFLWLSCYLSGWLTDDIKEI